MNNMIEVSFQRGVFNIVTSIGLIIRDQIFGIKTAEEANDKAEELKKEYEREGVHIEHLILW